MSIDSKQATIDIPQTVKSRYGGFAETGGHREACCGSAQTTASFALDQGLYGQAELALVPEGALNLSRGCGNPTGFAHLRAGEVVVDLGCGGGIDVILAAHQVGPTGRVVGVDMTPQMIDRARENVIAGGVGEQDIDFRVADVTAMPLPDASADVVISNCVINLCPDKDAAYREAFRVLRPGGRLAISDVVLTENVPDQLHQRFEAAWAGCLGGAVMEEDYLQKVTQAGFAEIQVVAHHPFTAEELGAMARCPGPDFTPAQADDDLAAVHGKVASIKFTAVKPAP
jgi:SAM-dependent methyltransferase